MQLERYAKLTADLRGKPKKDGSCFDTTKIPDIFDNTMYDMVHNQHMHIPQLPELYARARLLARFVVPREYGMGRVEKCEIGLHIGSAMLHKLQRDLLSAMHSSAHEQEALFRLDASGAHDVRSAARHVRTRLYFTSESHMHSLLNVLAHGAAVAVGDAQVPSIFSPSAHATFLRSYELSYVSHVVFRVLLKKSCDVALASSYEVLIYASSGATHVPETPQPNLLDDDGDDDACAEPCAATREQLVTAAPMARVSREGLTLEDMSRFISYLLRGHLALPAEVRKAIEQLGERGSNILHVEHLDQVLRGVSGDVADTPSRTPGGSQHSSGRNQAGVDSLKAGTTTKPRADTLKSPLNPGS
jgi:hypothetical protein